MTLISTLFYYLNLFQSSKVPLYTRSIYKQISFDQKLIGLKGLFQKPDKILLENPNLFKVLCFSSNISTIRESFFLSMLHKHTIRYSKKGDYFIDNKYTF